MALIGGVCCAACGAAVGGSQLPSGSSRDGTHVVVTAVERNAPPLPTGSPAGTHRVIIQLQVTAGNRGYIVSESDFRLVDEYGPDSLSSGGSTGPAITERLATALGRGCNPQISPSQQPNAGGGAAMPSPLAALGAGQSLSLELCFVASGPATQQLVLQWSATGFAPGEIVAIRL